VPSRSTVLAVAALAASSTVLSAAAANTVPIVTDVRTVTDGDTIRITYDVLDPDDDRMTVLLRFAGSEFLLDGPADGAGGEIGSGIASGGNKVITVSRERLPAELQSAPVARVLAHDGTGLGGEMIAVDSTSGPDYMIDRYELTNEQFAAFVRSDGYEMMEYWIIDDGSIEIQETGWNYAGRFRWQAPRYWDLTRDPPWSSDPWSNRATGPVLGVSWFEAYAYCKWAGRRLPTSGEWREAAGMLECQYPWGDGRAAGAAPPLYDLANVRLGYEGYAFEQFTSDGVEFAGPVGQFSPRGDSPLGLADVIGNVWEWCSDVVAVVDYGTFSCATRPLKGGSWATAMAELRDPTKDLCPLYRTDTVGFRCCR
jgi:formylglycine-generating enzyme required for sulfatase activity